VEEHLWLVGTLPTIGGLKGLGGVLSFSNDYAAARKGL
jgi:hypothetical protein